MPGRWTIQRALEEEPPGFHPLAGCDLENFRSHLDGRTDLSERTQTQRRRSYAAVLARQPFTIMEKLIFSKKVERYELPRPPVFLIGHWRSGTTHLHNLMSRGPDFATIDFGQTAMPHNLLNPTRFIGRAAIAAVIPKDRGMDQVELGIREPQEEEMAIGNLNPICYYNVFYYPQEMKRHFERACFLDGVSEAEEAAFRKTYVKLLRKLSIVGKNRRLLLKNPASTARIQLLDELFPGSCFISIVRNPYEVFASMLHHYPRLFNAFAWQDFADIDLEEIVFYKYARLMRGYLEQRASVGKRLLETSYEAIVSDPVAEIERFHETLNLEGREASIAGVQSYLKAHQNYKRNRYKLTHAQVERIQQEWGFALEEWGYDVPDSIAVV